MKMGSTRGHRGGEPLGRLQRLHSCRGAAHPKRLRGTAIVKPTVDRFALEEMSKAGIIGIRLPFIGLPALPDITTFEYRALFCRLADLGWHVHPHVDGDDLPKILPTLEASGVKIVVDHLGRPNPRDGIASEGFKALLRSVDKGRTWVKASGGYRLGPASVASSSAKARPYLSVAVEIELHGSFTENLGAGRRVGAHSLSQSIVARYGNWPSWPTNGQSLAHTKRSGAGGAQKLARVQPAGPAGMPCLRRQQRALVRDHRRFAAPCGISTASLRWRRLPQAADGTRVQSQICSEKIISLNTFGCASRAY